MNVLQHFKISVSTENDQRLKPHLRVIKTLEDSLVKVSQKRDLLQTSKGLQFLHDAVPILISEAEQPR